ncbi:hypothetical protein [uncultured Desulfovibrio sp.]|mgnify:FL=1|uniref:hypothetical protein n=1 Tax=uncultured Desulfovibrio sp. TaxID=167968 RepID=UPI002602B139|nr:hypothetical protein [uncultured Desulfovibrio sp.]
MNSIIKRIQQIFSRVTHWYQTRLNFKYAWSEAKASLMLRHILLDWKKILGGLFLGCVAAVYAIHSKTFDYFSMSQTENATWILFSVLTILFVIVSFCAEKFLRSNISIAKETHNIAIWLIDGIIASYAFVVSLSVFEVVYNKNFSVVFNIYLYLYYSDHFIKIKHDYVWKDYKVIATIIVGKKNDADA